MAFHLPSVLGLVFVLAVVAAVICQLARNGRNGRNGRNELSGEQMFDMGVDAYRREGMHTLRDVLRPEECSAIIDLALPRLDESMVYSDSKDRMSKAVRESDQCWLKPQDHPALRKISDLVSELTHLPVANQEPIQVVRYRPGGFYRPHYDACNGTEDFCRRFTGDGGQRYATLLVYLNDDMRGGETHFPIVSRDVVPTVGSAVFFLNADRRGRVIRESMHGGNPVTEGEKWIANVWVRLKPRKDTRQT